MIMREAPIAEDTVALVGAQVFAALAAAHRRGVVHRDVKPGNILLCQDVRDGHSHAKLLDFGVAKVLRDSCKDTIVEGAFTPSYGAPEQWSSEHGRQGPATDVFALALIVVELVTGSEALRGDASPSAPQVETFSLSRFPLLPR